jgi:sec-independent protein translocase protein TatA
MLGFAKSCSTQPDHPHPSLPPKRGKETSSKTLQVPIPLVLGFAKTYSTQPTRAKSKEKTMGFHGFSFGSLILILLLVVLLFGTKRLRTMGEDIGAAIKSFRKGLEGEEKKSESETQEK